MKGLPALHAESLVEILLPGHTAKNLIPAALQEGWVLVDVWDEDTTLSFVHNDVIEEWTSQDIVVLHACFSQNHFHVLAMGGSPFWELVDLLLILDDIDLDDEVTEYGPPQATTTEEN